MDIYIGNIRKRIKHGIRNNLIYLLKEILFLMKEETKKIYKRKLDMDAIWIISHNLS